MKRHITFLFLLMLVVSVLHSQDVNEVFKNRVEVYFSFKALSSEQVNELSHHISIDKVDDALNVIAYANKKGFSHFHSYGLDFEILQSPGSLFKPKMLENVDIKNITDWDFYPTYDAYVSMMYQFETEYPEICEVYSIGTTNNGRQLLVARITDNIGEQEAEPEFFYTSSMHGDETAGYVLMLRLIDHLLTNYGSDQRVTAMVDEIDIYINPLANPDGTYYGGNSSVNGAIRGNAFGIDLNRNFPDPEDGPHPDGNPWQTETVYFMDFAEERDFVLSSNIHGGEEVLNYPWDTWSHLTADNNWWVLVCREFADTVHVHAPSGYLSGFNNGITNGYQWYTIAGGRQDYMNYFHQCREFTHEISQIKLLPASQLPAHWNYNYRSFLNYIEQSLYGVRGKITDSATGDPIQAEVYVLNHEFDSSWVYSSLPAGNYHRLLFSSMYDIKFSKPGYHPQTFENIMVQNFETIVIDVELVDAFSDVGEATEIQFNMFPNPVSANFFKLNSNTAIDRISIYSMRGELCLEIQGNGNKLQFVDVSMLGKGMYIVQVESGLKKYRQKLIRR